MFRKELPMLLLFQERLYPCNYFLSPTLWAQALLKQKGHVWNTPVKTERRETPHCLCRTSSLKFEGLRIVIR